MDSRPYSQLILSISGTFGDVTDVIKRPKVHIDPPMGFSSANAGNILPVAASVERKWRVKQIVVFQTIHLLNLSC
jgi:hypothetical protein